MLLPATFSRTELERQLDEQRERVDEALAEFAENTVAHVRGETDLLTGDVQFPPTRARFRDRHVLIVVRGDRHRRDLKALRAYIRDVRPLVVAVDEQYAEECHNSNKSASSTTTDDLEWSGDTISNICKRYGTSRKTDYKWNNRYKLKGMEGLSNLSTRPHNINYKKITPELEETILDLRLTKRFGCNRIKFRLRKVVGIH